MREPPQRSGVRCEIVTTFSGLEELADKWHQWTKHDRLTDVFQQWPWARAFCRAYADTVSICVLVVYAGDKAIGVLPLLDRGGTLEFLGSPEADYNDLICEEGAEGMVLEAALQTLLHRQHQLGWESVVLDNLPASSRIVSNIAQLPPHLRGHLQLLVRSQSPTILLAENKMQVLDTLMSKDQLKRYDKRLGKTGNVIFRHIENRDEAHEHLGHFFSQHISRRAMADARSQFLRTDRCEFYRALVEECDLRTQIRFGVLELNSRPIAYHFGLQCNGKFIWYKPTFDVDYWDHRPGDVLLRHLFRYARDSDVREFDFSIGDEPFKFRFANHVKQNYVLYIEPHPSQIWSLVRKVIRPAEALARQQPALRHLFRHATRAASMAQRRLEDLRDYRRLREMLQILFRKAVWADEDILLFSGCAKHGQQDLGVEVAPVSLAGLAALSAANLIGLDAARLHECRRRLKEGDFVFIGRGLANQIVVLWLSRRDGVVLPEFGREFHLDLPDQALMLYECWTASPAAEVPARFLRSLAECFSGCQLWTYCLGRQTSVHQAIIDAGFHLRRLILHRAFLNCFSSDARITE